MDKAAENRDKLIVRTSVIGIVTNALLAAFKAIVGLSANSIAIVMDAVNNLSDAASSVITIVGTKLAGKEPDKKHPFGYGRVEYLSAMVISLIVLYAGVTAFVESVKAIISPDAPDYAPLTLIVVAVAVAAKLILGRYVKAMGERTHSDSLVNSGQDATLDAVISASTLAAAGIYLIFHISLEAWLGAIIAAVIIKSGIEMLAGTISQILGERADASLARDIKATVLSFPQVLGAYDLVLNNYGPDRFNGSIHIEVADTCTADELDRLIRQITVQVYAKHDVILTAIGVYSANTTDPHAMAALRNVTDIALSHAHVTQLHGFYIDQQAKTMRFDIVVSFDAKSRRDVCNDVCAAVQKAYPDYTLQVALDTDFSEA